MTVTFLERPQASLMLAGTPAAKRGKCACGQPATHLCDWKVPPRRNSHDTGTCDTPLPAHQEDRMSKTAPLSQSQLVEFGDLMRHASQRARDAIDPVLAIAAPELRAGIVHRVAYNFAEAAAIMWAYGQKAGTVNELVVSGVDHPEVARIMRAIGAALMAAPDRDAMDRALAEGIQGVAVDPSAGVEP